LNIFFADFSSYGSTAQFCALTASIKLSVSFQLLNLGQSAGLLEQVIKLVARPLLTVPGDCHKDEADGMNDFDRGN
jgi:hypothetical protein